MTSTSVSCSHIEADDGVLLFLSGNKSEPQIIQSDDGGQQLAVDDLVYALPEAELYILHDENGELTRLDPDQGFAPGV